MKTLKTLMVVMLILSVTFLLVQPVEARDYSGGHGGHSGGHGGGHRGGHGHGGGHHGGRGHAFFGGFGYGWWGYPYGWDYPYYPYYYPYYDPYYYGGYGEPPAPPQGVTPQAESGPKQPSFWRFCQDPEGYYPYVKDCPRGWLTVVPPKPNAPPPATLGAPILPPSPPGKKPEE